MLEIVRERGTPPVELSKHPELQADELWDWGANSRDLGLCSIVH